MVNARLRRDARRQRSGLGLVIARGLVDFLRRHLPGDVAHLLTDVVAPGARCEGLQLRLDIDRGLAVEPRAAGLVVESPWQAPQGAMLRIGAPVVTIGGVGRPGFRWFDGTRGR